MLCANDNPCTWRSKNSGCSAKDYYDAQLEVYKRQVSKQTNNSGNETAGILFLRAVIRAKLTLLFLGIFGPPALLIGAKHRC